MKIDKMSAEIDDLKSKLPKPYIVKRGDSHEKICVNFLVNEKGVAKDEAMKLIDEVRLIDEMMEGFNVWMYYNEGTFGTFVTQGSARISPNKFNRILRRRQLEAAKESGREEAMNQLKTDSLGGAKKDTTK
jgi:molybdopterin converting factor small subunit